MIESAGRLGESGLGHCGHLSQMHSQTIVGRKRQLLCRPFRKLPYPYRSGFLPGWRSGTTLSGRSGPKGQPSRSQAAQNHRNSSSDRGPGRVPSPL
jgi:hypothetical protein